MTVFHARALVLLFYVDYPPTFETKHKYDGMTKLQLLRQLDYIGLLLFPAGCILFLWGSIGEIDNMHGRALILSYQ